MPALQYLHEDRWKLVPVLSPQAQAIPKTIKVKEEV